MMCACSIINIQMKNIFFLLFTRFLHHLAGYYADVESRCQVFRVCATTDLTGKGKLQYAFQFICLH